MAIVADAQLCTAVYGHGGRRKTQQKCGGVDGGKVMNVVVEVVAALQGTQYWWRDGQGYKFGSGGGGGSCL